MGWQLCRGISGSFRLESVAGLLWNQWQLSCGTGGSFAVESVAGFTWNRWQLWRGIRSNSGLLRTAAHSGLSALTPVENYPVAPHPSLRPILLVTPTASTQH